MQINTSFFVATVLGASIASGGIGYYSCKMLMKQNISIACPDVAAGNKAIEDKPLLPRGDVPPLTGGQKF